MKSNTLTIIKKEFARFFGDRQLLFTTVIMPGLLIYIIYSFMGMGMEKMATEGTNEQVTVCVENLPVSMAPIVDGLPSTTVSQQPISQEDIDKLKAKDLNVVLVRFPEKFDEKVATYDPQSFEPAPNIEIYYNSANNASSRVYHMLEASLSSYEDQLSNRFDINRIESVEDQFDMASQDDVLGSILSKLIPMLILMMLFSGVMAIAPSSIAGEKERGTSVAEWYFKLHRHRVISAQDDTSRCGGAEVGPSLYRCRLYGFVANHLLFSAYHGLSRQPVVGISQGREECWNDDHAFHVGGDVLWFDAYVPVGCQPKFGSLSVSLLQLHPGYDRGLCPRNEMAACHRYLGRQRGVHWHCCLGTDPHVQQRKGDVLKVRGNTNEMQKRKSQPTLPFFILS